LRFDSWEDKQSGQKRSKLKVVLENVQFLSRGGGGGGAGAGAAAASGETPAVAGGDDLPADPLAPPARSGSKPAPGNPQKVEDDVPF
jgi:single-strand DNA-binding protein